MNYNLTVEDVPFAMQTTFYTNPIKVSHCVHSMAEWLIIYTTTTNIYYTVSKKV